MTATLTKESGNGKLATIDFGITPEMIAEKTAAYSKFDFATKDGYQEGSIALREVVSTRTGIERLRKEMKDDALQWGRKVDAAAKDATALVTPLENMLKDKKDAIDNERQRKLDEIKAEEDRRSAEAAERAKKEEESRLQAIRDAETAKMKAEREELERAKAKHAEELRALQEYQAEQRREQEAADRAERERLDAIAAEQRAAQAKIDAERAELSLAQAKIAALEEKKRLNEKAKQEALERVEREKKDAELARLKRIAAESAEAERLERLRPDTETLKSFAAQLRSLQVPAVKSEEARGMLDSAMKMICPIADALEKWQG